MRARAEAFGQAAIAQLKATGSWHPQGFARLLPTNAAGVPALTPGLAACASRWRSATAAASMVQAMAAEAGKASTSVCLPARRVELRADVLEIDREKQSLGDFFVHDMPALFGSTLGSFISLGTVTAMSKLVHRVVTLQVTIERDGASTVQLSARGAAGIGVGSLMMLGADTPLPREPMSVAFLAALRNLDAALWPPAAPECRSPAD